jgi:hypothetical protein
MNALQTIVVVHETTAPNVRRLLALCDDHVAIVKRAPWADVDEVVGFSTVMDCEACKLMEQSQPSLLAIDPMPGDGRSRLRAVPSQR